MIKRGFSKTKRGAALGQYWGLMICYFITFFGMSCYTPYINKYLRSLGFSDIYLGFMGAILPIMVLVFQPIWASIGDRTKKQQILSSVFLIGSALTALLYILKLPLIFYTGVTILYGVFSVSLSSMLDVVVLFACEKHGFRFSDFRLSATSGYAIGSLLLGFIIPDKLYLAFVFLAVFYIISGLLLLFVPKIHIFSSTDEDKDEPVKTSTAKEFFKNPEVIMVLIFLVAVYLGSIFFNLFLSILLDEIAAPSSLLGIMMFINCLSELPIITLAERLVRKFGEIKLMIFAGGIIVLRLSLAATGSIPMIFLSEIIQGLGYQLNFYVGILYMNRTLAPEQKTMGQGAISIAQNGVGHILASVIGGILLEGFGVKLSYLMIGLIVGAIYIITLLVFYIRKRAAIK